MAKRDYYQVLGVSRTASEKDIRQAYRRLARQSHPDLNPNDKPAEARFKELHEAYDVISDPEKRKKYDQFGHEWERFEKGHGATGQGQTPWGDVRWTSTSRGGTGFENPFGEGLEDLLGGLFGQAGRGTGRTHQSQRRGQDIEHPVEMSLDEAFTGTQRTLQLREPTGASRTIEVKIPPGVAEGSRVRIAGKGERGIGGGPTGDLFLLISVRPHPVFERKGDDLKVKTDVPLHIALLGGEVNVLTLRGSLLVLKIPPETQNGQTFLLRGQGMPKLGGAGRGDLIAEARVVLPTGLSQREKELFNELATLRTG